MPHPSATSSRPLPLSRSLSASLPTTRGGSVPFEDVRLRALELDRLFQEAFAATRLPERPDYDRVNRFLISARRRMVR